MSGEPCACTCGLLGCASRPGRTVRMGVTVHGSESGYRYGCRCAPCTTAMTKATVEQQRQVNLLTLRTATHHREPWTGPQLEIALRGDLSAREAALMLGRSRQAVKHIRAKGKSDPKYVNLAGVPKPEGP